MNNVFFMSGIANDSISGFVRLTIGLFLLIATGIVIFFIKYRLQKKREVSVGDVDLKISENSKKKRETNLELLRIISMVMIITLHYLDKGYALKDIVAILPGDGNFLNELLAWCLEVFSYGAVNLYILISGYFLINCSARMEKPFKIVIQVLFYSLGIFLIFMIIGVVQLGELPDYATDSFYTYTFFTPIASSHYWFASTYVFFYILAPFLAVGLRKLNKIQHLGLIIITMLLFSRLWRILLPMTEPVDDRGYGIQWFVTLFVLASYIRRYVPVKKNRRWVYLGIYFFAGVLTIISFFTINKIFVMTGKYGIYTKVLLEYNSPTIIVASASLFLFFRTLSIPEGFLSKIILYVSPLTFGIYLIHEHFLLRNLWTELWQVNAAFTKPWFILHYIACIFDVFVICGAIEWIRKSIFDSVYKTKLLQWFFGKLRKLDVIFPKKDDSL